MYLLKFIVVHPMSVIAMYVDFSNHFRMHCMW